MRKIIVLTISTICILCNLVILAGVLFTYFSSPQPYTPTVITYQVPAEVQPIVTRLGIDPSIIAKVDIKLDSGIGPCTTLKIDIRACYDNNVIYYPREMLVQPEGVQNQLFAHEYLHFIWETQPEPKALTPSLLAIHANNAKLQQRIVGYPQSSLAWEIYSYICTEMQDDRIPADILVECIKYLPNRGALPSDY